MQSQLSRVRPTSRCSGLIVSRLRSFLFAAELDIVRALMKKLAATLTLVLLASAPLLAEIEKLAIPGEKGLDLYWWPKLPPVTGWHHDREHSLRYGANALAPDGFTFASADAVIYAKAVYKPRQPEISSLASFIASDKKAFLSSNQGLNVAEASSIVTADGHRLQSFTFLPAGAGNWERVAYGEEGEYYLVFTVSSRSLAAYNAALLAYEKLIGAYKEAP
jgi:hypothetical protein